MNEGSLKWICLTSKWFSSCITIFNVSAYNKDVICNSVHQAHKWMELINEWSMCENKFDYVSLPHLYIYEANLSVELHPCVWNDYKLFGLPTDNSDKIGSHWSHLLVMKIKRCSSSYYFGARNLRFWCKGLRGSKLSPNKFVAKL